MGIHDIPSEIVEEILLWSDPLDVSAFAQTCQFFHRLVYHSEDQHLWRDLYLAQPFDDPRTCISYIGYPKAEVDWKRELQRIIRARTVVSAPNLCRPDERCKVLETLMDMACNATPLPTAYSDSEQISLNLLWIAALLRGGAFFGLANSFVSDAERQLSARLHTFFGLIPSDAKRSRGVECRAFVYNMRNYKWDNDFGPFLMDSGGRVNWVHVKAIHHVMSMHLVELNEDEEFAFTIFPMSMPFCQSIIPPGMDLDKEKDWAGVEGSWKCAWCFCDHRELLIYNNFNASERDTLDPSVFEDPDFMEIYRSLEVEFRVISTEPDPVHPTRPRIHFAGEMMGNSTMVGWVGLTPDHQVRWHFVSGDGQAVWSSEGVQIGGIRSQFGILGSWTTVFHDLQDPVGPFWLRKVYPEEPP